jgi:hypothetical protein
MVEYEKLEGESCDTEGGELIIRVAGVVEGFPNKGEMQNLDGKIASEYAGMKPVGQQEWEDSNVLAVDYTIGKSSIFDTEIDDIKEICSNSGIFKHEPVALVIIDEWYNKTGMCRPSSLREIEELAWSTGKSEAGELSEGQSWGEYAEDMVEDFGE